ncbi:Cenp-O kinetochore centromere component-domain-containing protein [Aspergillus egyptiacus]|nr:Cenp-O kinetochore centromere component-domain-containing protein [Aspergillus egyptiacus]
MDLHDPTTQLEEELDSEISSIRREIRKLQRRRRFLSSSILSSESLQRHVKPQPAAASSLFSLDDDISPLVRAAGAHSQSNHHRVAFSTTTFAFKDPSPQPDVENGSSKKLLGVRIDICIRNGRFTKPYYLLLRKVRTSERDQGADRVRVHRHTIPAFIPVERLERIFLPDSPPESTDVETQAEPLQKKKLNAPMRKQNLSAFVREIRRQLVAWHTRLDAVYYLRERLGVIRRGADTYPDKDEEGPWDRDVLMNVDFDSGVGETRLKENDLGIVMLSPTALEASYVRMEWEDGRVGRFKISNSGLVERAVVIGDEGRDKAMEAVLAGGDRKVLTVLDRLKQRAANSGTALGSD